MAVGLGFIGWCGCVPLNLFPLVGSVPLSLSMRLDQQNHSESTSNCKVTRASVTISLPLPNSLSHYATLLTVLLSRPSIKHVLHSASLGGALGFYASIAIF